VDGDSFSLGTLIWTKKRLTKKRDGSLQRYASCEKGGDQQGGLWRHLERKGGCPMHFTAKNGYREELQGRQKAKNRRENLVQGS